jgi:hypothetical protein
MQVTAFTISGEACLYANQELESEKFKPITALEKSATNCHSISDCATDAMFRQGPWQEVNITAIALGLVFHEQEQEDGMRYNPFVHSIVHPEWQFLDQ